MNIVRLYSQNYKVIENTLNDPSLNLSRLFIIFGAALVIYITISTYISVCSSVWRVAFVHHTSLLHQVHGFTGPVQWRRNVFEDTEDITNSVLKLMGSTFKKWYIFKSFSQNMVGTYPYVPICSGAPAVRPLLK